MTVFGYVVSRSRDPAILGFRDSDSWLPLYLLSPLAILVPFRNYVIGLDLILICSIDSLETGAMSRRSAWGRLAGKSKHSRSRDGRVDGVVGYSVLPDVPEVGLRLSRCFIAPKSVWKAAEELRIVSGTVGASPSPPPSRLSLLFHSLSWLLATLLWAVVCCKVER